MSGTEFLIAGFGGQGLLFAGKFLTYRGLLEGKQVSWLPSYGPEMRGGTANCSVIISDEPIGSPIVNRPDVLMVMNLPSLEKYEAAVKAGGRIFADSTLVPRAAQRSDVSFYGMPATQLAKEAGMPGLANMLLTGRMLREVEGFSLDYAEQALRKVISPRHQDMLQLNFKALQLGFHFGEE